LHYFDRFLSVYERRFKKEYGYFRPVVQEVVERYLDCANRRSDFARIRCPDCGAEHLLMFSCKTRGFCPSCHAKRLEEWGEWARETLLLDVPHRQVVLTIPKTLRIFFKFRRKLLGGLCRSAARTLTAYFETLAGEGLVPGIIAAVQAFGERINFHPHLHFLVAEGGVDLAGIFHRIPRWDDSRLAELETMGYLEFIARVASHIPDKGQVMVRYYNLYANAHRGKVRKTNRVPVPLGMTEEEPGPARGRRNGCRGGSCTCCRKCTPISSPGPPENS